MLIWNIQWTNQNSQRSFPLTDAATKRDLSDTITIPDSFIVGLYFPVHAGLDIEPDRFFVRSLTIFPTGYNIAIAYDDGTSDPPTVASVNIAKSTHAENRTYALPGTDEFADGVGQIVIGALNEIEQLPPGQYFFDRAGGALETAVIRPNIRGISSITVVSGSDRSEKLYGDIELVAGRNFRIVANIVGGQDPQIVFSAIEGEGLNEECVCDESAEGPCIRTINGIPPAPDGNFQLIGDDCIEISPEDHGLLLSDKCSSPCCGCNELDALVAQIDRFATGAATLRNFINNLSGAVTQFHTVVLGSRLNDSGCLDC